MDIRLHEAMAHLGRVASEGADEKTILSAAVSSLAQSLGLVSVTAYLCGDGGRARRYAAVGALGRRPEVASLEKSLTEKAVRVCRPFSQASEHPGEPGRKLYTLAQPFRPGRLVQGALSATAYRPFGRTDKQLFDALAGLVGSLLERDAYSQQVSLTSNRLIALITLAREMVTELEMSDFVHMVVETARQAAQADTAAFFTVDTKLRRLRLEVAVGAREREMKNVRARWGHGTIGRAWARVQPVIGRPRPAATGREPGRLVGDRVLSTMAVPVTYQDVITGIIYVEAVRPGPAFTDVDTDVLTLLAGFVGTGWENAVAYNELRTLYMEAMEELIDMCEQRDHELHGHAGKVARNAVQIARQMGRPKSEQEVLRHAGLLHDVGMTAVDSRVLAKEGPLTQEERKLVQKHPEISAGRLKPLEVLRDVVPVVRSHHERVDGYGYPDGLTGDSIPLEARILAVADAYAAMTSPRRYRRALKTADAIGELRKNVAEQFDAEVVEAFVEVLERRSRGKGREAKPSRTAVPAKPSPAAAPHGRAKRARRSKPGSARR